MLEDVVRQVIGVRGAAVLRDIVYGAWDAYVEEGRERRHRSTRAAIVWDHMAILADEKLAKGCEAVVVAEPLDRPIIIVRDLFALRPKFHDRSGRTRNYRTRAVRELDRTGLLPGVDVPLLSFGYRLDAAEAGVEQALIASPVDDWIIDLDELASGGVSLATPLFQTDFAASELDVRPMFWEEENGTG